MAGRHGRDMGPARGGTDAGPAWELLTPEERAAEMDASHDDPTGYAERNFDARSGSTGSQPTGY